MTMDYAEVWRQIQSGQYDYHEPEAGMYGGVYLTDDYVFESISEGADGTWKSSFVVDALHQHGANVPEVLFRSQEDDVVVFERIEGPLLLNIDNPGREVGVAVGDALRQVHALDFETLGDPRVGEDADDGMIQGELSTAEEYVDYVIEVTDSFIHDSSMFRPVFEKARETARGMEAYPEVGGICHFDYVGKNVIYNGDEAHVIDFDNCELGFTGADLVHTHLMINRARSDGFEKGFFEGYDGSIGDLSSVEVAFGLMRTSSRGSFRERLGEEPRVSLSRVEAFMERHL